MNTYAYVSANPLIKFDPNGLEEQCDKCDKGNQSPPIDDKPLENVYPELLLLGGMAAMRGIGVASEVASAEIASAIAAAKNFANRCKNVRCELKKEGPHHFFAGYGWCEHFRLTCYRKGVKEPPFISTQVRAPLGKCVPLKNNGGKAF